MCKNINNVKVKKLYLKFKHALRYEHAMTIFVQTCTSVYCTLILQVTFEYKPLTKQKHKNLQELIFQLHGKIPECIN